MAAMTRLRPEVGGVRKDGRQERVRVGAGLALVEVGEGAEEARATGDLVQQLGDAHPRQHGVEPIPERLHLGQRGRADLADVELLSRSSTRSSSPRASRCAKRFSRQSSSRPGLPATHRPWTEGPSRRRSAPPSQPAACSCRSGDRPRTPRPTCRPSGACCAGGPGPRSLRDAGRHGHRSRPPACHSFFNGIGASGGTSRRRNPFSSRSRRTAATLYQPAPRVAGAAWAPTPSSEGFPGSSE